MWWTESPPHIGGAYLRVVHLLQPYASWAVYLYAFHLFDVVLQSAMQQIVLKSIAHKGRHLALTGDESQDLFVDFFPAPFPHF